MTTHTFDRLLLPVADIEDAQRTSNVVRPLVEANETSVVLLHVAETPQRQTEVSLDARRNAEHLFDVFRDEYALAPIQLETMVRSGPDIASEIARAATDVDATAIGILPRPTHDLMRLVSDETTKEILSETDAPVVVFPRREEPASMLNGPGSAGETSMPTVVIPLSGSSSSTAAVADACAGYDQPSVLLLQVIADTDAHSETTPTASTAVTQSAEQQRTALLNELQPVTPSVSTATEVGDVASTVREYALTHGADIIAVTALTSEGPAHHATETTQKTLLHNSPVPVVIV